MCRPAARTPPSATRRNLDQRRRTESPTDQRVPETPGRYWKLYHCSSLEKERHHVIFSPFLRDRRTVLQHGASHRVETAGRRNVPPLAILDGWQGVVCSHVSCVAKRRRQQCRCSLNHLCRGRTCWLPVPLFLATSGYSIDTYSDGVFRRLRYSSTISCAKATSRFVGYQIR